MHRPRRRLSVIALMISLHHFATSVTFNFLLGLSHERLHDDLHHQMLLLFLLLLSLAVLPFHLDRLARHALPRRRAVVLLRLGLSR